MRKYFYEYDMDKNECIEACPVMHREFENAIIPTLIGSVICKACEHCRGYDNDDHWLKCTKLDEILCGEEVKYMMGESIEISEDQGGGIGYVMAYGKWNDTAIAILDMTNNKGGNPDMHIFAVSYLNSLKK